MDKFLSTVAALLTMTSVSQANNRFDTIEVFDWEVIKVVNDYDNRGVACGLRKEINNNSTIIIQYHVEEVAIAISLYKDTWNIPANAKAPFYLYFGEESPWTMWASPTDKDMLVAYLARYGREHVTLGAFGYEFQNTDNLRIQFDGNEPDWNVSLRHGDVAFSVFKKCIKDITNTDPFEFTPSKPEETQPFNDTEHRIPLSPVFPRPGEQRKF